MRQGTDPGGRGAAFQRGDKIQGGEADGFRKFPGQGDAAETQRRKGKDKRRTSGQGVASLQSGRRLKSEGPGGLSAGAGFGGVLALQLLGWERRVPSWYHLWVSLTWH